MSNKTDKLTHTVTDAGGNFTLEPGIKNKTFPPHSKGFVSFVLGPDYNNPNVVFQKVVTTRRGKQGKMRIDVNILLSPIFTVPNVNIESLIIINEVDNKNFIDMLITPTVNYNMMNSEIMSNITFIANILSRGLFMRELDQTLFKPDTSIMQNIGITNKKQIYVWPKNKNSLLRRLVEESEQLFNIGETDSLFTLFCSPNARREIVKELRVVESLLTIPKLEYKRKVYGVLLNALTHIKTQVSKQPDKMLKDKIKVINDIENLKKEMKAQKTETIKESVGRLDIILKNRKLIEY